MTWLVIAATLGVVGRWVYSLLGEAVSDGTGRDHGVRIAEQVMAEANAFRGSSLFDDAAWDGQNRLGRVSLLP